MILKGLFSVASFRLGTAFISFILILLLMNFLSLEDFALYSVCFTWFTFFSMIPNIGVNNHLVLNGGNNDIVVKSINLRVYTILVIFFLIYIAFYLNLITNTVFYSMSAGLFSSIFDLELSFRQAKKDLRKMAFFMPVKTLIIFFISILTLLYQKNYVESVFRNHLIIYLIFFIIWWLINLKNNFFQIKENLQIYWQSRNFILFELSSLIMARSEVFILSFYDNKNIVSEIDLANFWSSYNFILIISMLGVTLSSVILPYMKDERRDYSKINSIINKTFLIMLALVFFITIFSWIIGEFFIEKYNGIYLFIFFMCVGVIFSFLNGVDRMKIIAGSGSNSLANKVIMIQVLLSIVLNIILIYFYGVWGAVATFVFIRFFAWYFMRKGVNKCLA